MPEEELSLKEQMEYLPTVFRARRDPVWFMKEILDWKSMWPKQEEIIRKVYQYVYDPTLPVIKELAWVSGQRCKGETSLILTNFGLIRLKDLFPKNIEKNLCVNKPVKLSGINIFNGSNWVPATEIIYAGKKKNCIITLESDIKTEGSYEHKYMVLVGVYRIWRCASNLQEGDVLELFTENKKQYGKIKSIEFTDSYVDMYDLHVPNGNCYVADGILTHNSGKSVTVGHLGAYEFFKVASLADPAKYFGLMRRQPIAISCIAAGKEQAIDGIYTLLSVSLEESEWIQQWWGDKIKINDSGRIDFKSKNIFVQVKAARADTGAGYTSSCVIFDELDLFQKNTDSKISAENVFRKMVNSTTTLGNNGKVFSISSLDNVDGMMSRVYYNALKKTNAIALNYTTWQVNPNPEVSEANLRKEFEFDMESFYKYFMNRPDISSGLLFPGGVKLDKSIPNVLKIDDPRVLEEAQNHRHALAVDPGHRNDSFGLSVGYREDNNIVIDGTMRFEKQGEDAYIKPSDIENAMTEYFSSLNVTDLGFDVDTILYMVEKAETEWGINTWKRHADSEAYGIWWNLNEGKDPELTLSITYDEHLKRECDQLQKLKTPTGKAKINHPYSGCFVGETRIRLLDGTCPQIKDLVELGDFWVCSCTSNGDLVPGKGRARLTKYVTELVDVVLDSGAIIRCTPDHRFMLRSGKYKEAKDIVPDIDRLMPCNISHIGNDGYYSYSHPLRNDKEKNDYSRKSVHRIIARCVYGKDIIDGELIHHINGEKTDNRPENLEVIKYSEHAAYHSTRRHAECKEYSQKATNAMYKFNTSAEGKKLRSEVAKRVVENLSKEDRVNRARASPLFRSDVTIEMLIGAKLDGAENAFQASKICNCGRNVIIRVLKDHGYSSWNEFVNQKGSNHRALYVISIKLDEPIPVYDIEVDKYHNFALMSGVFVHNSKDQSDTVANLIWYLKNNITGNSRTPIGHMAIMQ